LVVTLISLSVIIVLSKQQGETDMTTTSAEVGILDISKLVPFSLGNSRVHRNSEKRKQLRDSIEAQGVIQPITVRPSQNSDDVFEVVAGFGRYEESQALGIKTIPALIKAMTDEEAFEAHLSENLIRNDLSIVDECKAAQKFISMAQGDYTEAAKRLGWTDKKLSDRVQLLRCCDAVLEALSNNEIRIGHAIILSSFTEKLQQGTLAKILSEKWSLSYLKERSGKAKKYIHTAKFDCVNCGDCQHNTLPQNDMFGSGLQDKAMCSNLACWKTKTTSWVSEQRVIAEEKYGKVLLFIESGEDDRSTVTPSAVGKDQFNSCVSCESRAAIIDDRDSREGLIIESQCLDQVCFSKCEKSHAKSLKTPKPKKVTEQVDSNSTPVAKETTVAKAPVVQKTPAAVTDNELASLRVSAYGELKGNAQLKQGMVIALLNELGGFKCDLLGSSRHDFVDNVLKCLDQTPETLQGIIAQSMEHFFTVTTKDDSTKNPTTLLIKALSTKDNAKEVAIRTWLANEKTLSNYTISGVVVLCQESGFIEAFEANTENVSKKVTFGKISKLGKKAFIKKVIAFNYDWSAYAPSTMLKHVS